MSKIAFITGASSGFGKACAEKFAANGYNLILNARREDRLNEISNVLKEQYGIQILLRVFDVREQQAVSDAVTSLHDEWKAIDVLVNNAGLALGRDYFEEADLDDWNIMVDTNIKGFAYVAKAVSQLMVLRKQGHIINMGSVAGKLVYERGNMYCATKSAVDALSHAMRVDMLRHNIKVTAIHPGAAETEFSVVRFKGDETSARNVYAGLQPLTAADVADVIFYTTTLPPHVCINDLVITPTQQADGIYMHRH
ncbi:SDR family NAD(P)-dependent oxidoreductase [Terrimonas sp. NA20]|uniref:SDR family NAD(P)-dependent oxidoreductase n=1 Tax=Terrimonas ginsenosidimutans TaxID=2908004 RepID=A0ABS9KPA4_9BACT|nr:SDR family NAD(P)-dependent oxidoreductase [Terrimonas ginsenosidimutans]MCG2614163.1 SDR family NAD(P)-dependent oxidoreductase [Terrimonas ginsenosidimutans]